MESRNGYQIVEPASLSKLVANPSQIALTLAIMDWIASRLISDFPELAGEVDLEVIPVTYHGTYPAFGVKYKSGESEDLSEKIASAIDSIISEHPVSQVLPYFANSTSNWCDSWRKLKEKFSGNS